MILPTKHNPTRVKRWATHSKPMLAGATLRDRMIACIGALFGIAVTALVCRVTASDVTLPYLVAPIGASAVLLFAVPASPLAQPWSIVGGNTVSALIGIAMAKLVTDPALAAGLAVALAIGEMASTSRSPASISTPASRYERGGLDVAFIWIGPAACPNRRVSMGLAQVPVKVRK